MNRQRGFSLVETVISIAIMGVVIVTVLGVFVTGNNAIKKGRSIVIATNIAEKKISEVRNLLAKNPDYLDPIDEGLFRASITGIDTIDPNSIVIWNYSGGAAAAMSDDITITGVEEIPRSGDYGFEITIKDYTDSTPSLLPDLKKITVKVSWTDPPSTIVKEMKISSLIAKE